VGAGFGEEIELERAHATFSLQCVMKREADRVSGWEHP
jgi:hypothetical protein